jgi:ATP-binding cassette, subfamily G (WHITE), member 2, PDR
MDLLGSLARSGHAILCVLDNPSTRLFERFDRLLLLAKGGKPVYFGEIGPNASTVIHYFEINGANTMPENANPAHWILEAIGMASSGSSVDVDWARVWRQSPENFAILNHLAKLKFTTARTSKILGFEAGQGAIEFSTPFHRQLGICLMRLFRHYWRTPSYIYSNLIFSLLAALFIGIGISGVPESLQGFESQFFSVLILMIVFRYIAQQIVTQFYEHRELFEAMEGPSKMYTWKVFMLSTMLVELPWNFITATLLFFCYYFPSGLFKNDNNTHNPVERAILTFLLFFSITVFTSTFAHLAVSPVKSERHARALTGLGFFFSLMFCG